MPRTYEMSWEGGPAYRWRKMFRGVMYRVTCVELGAMVFTKEGSYRLANEWWRNKLAELTKPSPLEAFKTRYVEADLEQQVRRLEAAQAALEVLRANG